MNKGVTSLWGTAEATTDSTKQVEPTTKKSRRKDKGSDEAGPRPQKSINLQYLSLTHPAVSSLTVPTVTLSDLGGIEACKDVI